MVRRNTWLPIILAVFMLFTGDSLGEKSAEEFFEQFGYLPERTGVDRTQAISPEKLEAAISKFQEFNGLVVTGILDPMTRRKMFQPRCGVKDFSGEGASFRQYSKWNKKDLTWSLREFSRTSKLTREQQLNAIKKAFNHWSSVTQLTFREVPHGGDIAIRFAAGNHGDGNSFDGPGNVLAHAFFPQNGDTHFDDAEKWTLKTDDGINLEIVAAHEFGHALGLAHSQVPSALMAPYYKGYTPDFKLDDDDIKGIQGLYGIRRQVTRPTSPPRTTRRRVYGTGYCRHTYNKISAIVRVLGRIDYVFVDKEFVISSKTGQKQPIRSMFPRGPSRVEAAVYSKETNQVYLTNGNKIWAFSVRETGTRFKLNVGYPKKMRNDTSIAHMDALIGLDMSNMYFSSVRLFILKGRRFWEVIPKYNYVSGAYSTSYFFQNMPRRYDTTLTVDDLVYFVSNNMFYRMNSRKRTVSPTGIPLEKALLRCSNY